MRLNNPLAIYRSIQSFFETENAFAVKSWGMTINLPYLDARFFFERANTILALE